MAEPKKSRLKTIYENLFARKTLEDLAQGKKEEIPKNEDTSYVQQAVARTMAEKKRLEEEEIARKKKK